MSSASEAQTPRIPALGEIVRGLDLPEFSERTVGAMIAERGQRLGAKEAVRSKGPDGKWRELSYAGLDERRRRIAAVLIAQGLQPGERVFVLSPNSLEMLVSELAVISVGGVSTPIFPDYSLELLRHCLRDCGARIALAASAAQQQKLAEVSGGQLERILVLDGAPLSGDDRVLSLPALEQAFSALSPEAKSRALAEVDSRGAAVGANDRAFLLYTSGTTGRPKGVPLTHRNVLSQQAAVAGVWSVSSADIFLSYLPWHHCFGALFERLMALWHGASLVLDDSRGRDLEKLLANFREVQPTLYMSVPRVYQALIARAQADAKIKSMLLHPGLRFVFTAAAPLPEGCYQFFEDANIPVHEGWGLTETSPDATLTGQGERRAGATGWPLPGTEVLLERGEESAPDPLLGEVLVRGPQVTSGYHGDPEASRQVLRSDGFLRTGDLGVWTAHGLRISGRVDGVFKLLNGEKVSSGEVEARILAASPLLEQAVVLGPGQRFTTALLWLNTTAARAFLEERGLHEGDAAATTPAQLSKTPEIRRALIEALQSANLMTTVSYERVQRAAMVAEPLTLERSELTPSLKVIRRSVTEHHAALVELLRSERVDAQILELHKKGDAL